MCIQSTDTLGSSNQIIETVIRIDKLQKEIISDTNTCVTCDISLVSGTNNTIPVAFTMCGGNLFNAIYALPDSLTNFFRIESVRDRRFVTLRLLEAVEVEGTYVLVATNHTVILDLYCVCSMQCFSPITITPCVTSNQV